MGCTVEGCCPTRPLDYAGKTPQSHVPASLVGDCRGFSGRRVTIQLYVLLHQWHPVGFSIPYADHLAGILLAASHEALGQTAQALTAYRQALQHDANLGAVQAKIDALRQQLGQ